MLHFYTHQRKAGESRGRKFMAISGVSIFRIYPADFQTCRCRLCQIVQGFNLPSEPSLEFQNLATKSARITHVNEIISGLLLKCRL